MREKVMYMKGLFAGIYNMLLLVVTLVAIACAFCCVTDQKYLELFKESWGIPNTEEEDRWKTED